MRPVNMVLVFVRALVPVDTVSFTALTPLLPHTAHLSEPGRHPRSRVAVPALLADLDGHRGPQPDAGPSHPASTTARGRSSPARHVRRRSRPGRPPPAC